MEGVLRDFAAVGGLAGIGLGAFLLVAREPLKKMVLAKFDSHQSQTIVTLSLKLTFALSTLCIVVYFALTYHQNYLRSEKFLSDYSEKESMNQYVEKMKVKFAIFGVELKRLGATEVELSQFQALTDEYLSAVARKDYARSYELGGAINQHVIRTTMAHYKIENYMNKTLNGNAVAKPKVPFEDETDNPPKPSR